MDVLFYQTVDGGDLKLVDNDVLITESLQSAVYISLFGSRTDAPKWWGDIDDLAVNSVKSETLNELEAKPLTLARRLPVERAAFRDLSWILDEGLADDISVSVSIPRLNEIQINIIITISGENNAYVFKWLFEPVC